MMIDDHDHDEHNEHDEHDDDHVIHDMHDMHTNTMHHAWCQRMPQGNTQRMNTQMHKNTKTKEMLQKHARIFKGANRTMAFKKTMATKQDEHKGGPKRIRDPLK